MKILGIDPGTARMGCAILDISRPSKPKLLHSTVLITTVDMETPDRLAKLFREIVHIIDNHKPDIMVIEQLFFNTNAKTAINVGQARGISLLAAATNNMKVFEYTALQAKLVLTGYGRADKKDMQNSVQKQLSLKDIIKSDDENDAVAMALCHLKKTTGDYEVKTKTKRKPTKSR